ncbi:hypothetical protein AB0J35_22985 [Nonomuraea angiospora]|uniref:hypothetical protein n=1 Tax=Nonomuraea angiospora TaxID=46172 RepID=UPI003421F6BB
MADIGYLDALQMWLSGNPALQDATLYGMSMLWWGRFGKILAFLGGMTVVLDILGPDRIREYGGRLRAIPKSPTNRSSVWAAALTALGTCAAAIMGAVVDVATGPGRERLALTVLVIGVVIAVVWVTLAVTRSKLFESTFNGIAWVLEHRKALIWWRVVSFFALVIGFHFDLLAS